MIRWFASIVLLLTFVASSVGCLVSSGRHSYESGTRVSSYTLAQIKPGETTEGWLIAALGEPTSRAAVEGEENVELLRYAWKRSRSSSGRVFLLYRGSRQDVDAQMTYFELRDGIVHRYWTER